MGRIDDLIHGMPTDSANVAHARPGFKLTYTVTEEISLKQVGYLLSSALEGGSNYWYKISKFIEPPALDFRTDPEQIYRYLDYPLSTDGALIIDDREGDKEHSGKRLDKDSILKGLEIMSQKYPKHFGDFRSDNGDADTGDVFLQCCLFGELVFG